MKMQDTQLEGTTFCETGARNLPSLFTVWPPISTTAAVTLIFFANVRMGTNGWRGHWLRKFALLMLTMVVSLKDNLSTARMEFRVGLLTEPQLGVTAAWEETSSTDAIAERVQVLMLAEAPKSRSTFLPGKLPQLIS